MANVPTGIPAGHGPRRIARRIRRAMGYARPIIAATAATITSDIAVSLLDAIQSSGYPANVQYALAVGTALECDASLGGNCGCGDGGWSCGPWQINRKNGLGVGYSAAQTSDVRQALAIVGPAYNRCAGQQNWGDPHTAAWNTVLCAENPDRTRGYAAQGMGAFTSLFQRIEARFAGLPDPTGQPASIGPVDPNTPLLGGALGAAGVWQAQDTLAYANGIIGGLTSHDTWIRALLILGGAAGVLVALQMFLHGAIGSEAAQLPAVIPV